MLESGGEGRKLVLAIFCWFSVQQNVSKLPQNDVKWIMNNFQTMDVWPLERQYRRRSSPWRFSNERIDNYLWPYKLKYK